LRTIRFLKELPAHHWLLSYQRHLSAQDLSPATIRGYLYDVNHFRLWMLETLQQELPLRAISKMDVASYRHYMLQIKQMRAAAINRQLQALKNFFRWAFSEGFVKEHPTEDVRFVRKTQRMKPWALKDKEVYALLREAGKSSHGLSKRNLAIIQVLVQTGLRASELVSLKRGDLEINERSGAVRIRGGKGLKERQIPLNASVRRALKDHLEDETGNPDDVVFQSRRNQPLSVRSLQHTVQALVHKAKIERIAASAHTLRHTFASNFLKNNPGKLVELATLMGHDSLDTTAVYTRPSIASLANDVERLPSNAF